MREPVGKAEVPENETPAQGDAVVQRGRTGDVLQPCGQLGEREEGAREQEQRDDGHSVDEGKGVVVLLLCS